MCTWPSMILAVCLLSLPYVICFDAEFIRKLWKDINDKRVVNKANGGKTLFPLIPNDEMLKLASTLAANLHNNFKTLSPQETLMMSQYTRLDFSGPLKDLCVAPVTTPLKTNDTTSKPKFQLLDGFKKLFTGKPAPITPLQTEKVEPSAPTPLTCSADDTFVNDVYQKCKALQDSKFTSGAIGAKHDEKNYYIVIILLHVTTEGLMLWSKQYSCLPFQVLENRAFSNFLEKETLEKVAKKTFQNGTYKNYSAYNLPINETLSVDSVAGALSDLTNETWAKVVDWKQLSFIGLALQKYGDELYLTIGIAPNTYEEAALTSLRDAQAAVKSKSNITTLNLTSKEIDSELSVMLADQVDSKTPSAKRWKFDIITTGINSAERLLNQLVEIELGKKGSFKVFLEDPATQLVKFEFSNADSTTSGTVTLLKYYAQAMHHAKLEREKMPPLVFNASVFEDMQDIEGEYYFNRCYAFAGTNLAEGSTNAMKSLIDDKEHNNQLYEESFTLINIELEKSSSTEIRIQLGNFALKPLQVLNKKFFESRVESLKSKKFELDFKLLNRVPQADYLQAEKLDYVSRPCYVIFAGNEFQFLNRDTILAATNFLEGWNPHKNEHDWYSVGNKVAITVRPVRGISEDGNGQKSNSGKQNSANGLSDAFLKSLKHKVMFVFSTKLLDRLGNKIVHLDMPDFKDTFTKFSLSYCPINSIFVELVSYELPPNEAIQTAAKELESRPVKEFISAAKNQNFNCVGFIVEQSEEKCSKLKVSIHFWRTMTKVMETLNKVRSPENQLSSDPYVIALAETQLELFKVGGTTFQNTVIDNVTIPDGYKDEIEVFVVARLEEKASMVMRQAADTNYKFVGIACNTNERPTVTCLYAFATIFDTAMEKLNPKTQQFWLYPKMNNFKFWYSKYLGEKPNPLFAKRKFYAKMYNALKNHRRVVKIPPSSQKLPLNRKYSYAIESLKKNLNRNLGRVGFIYDEDLHIVYIFQFKMPLVQEIVDAINETRDLEYKVVEDYIESQRGEGDCKDMECSRVPLDKISRMATLDGGPHRSFFIQLNESKHTQFCVDMWKEAAKDIQDILSNIALEAVGIAVKKTRFGSNFRIRITTLFFFDEVLLELKIMLKKDVKADQVLIEAARDHALFISKQVRPGPRPSTSTETGTKIFASVIPYANEPTRGGAILLAMKEVQINEWESSEYYGFACVREGSYYVAVILARKEKF